MVIADFNARQQGLALIVVLWMLTLLMIMAGSFAMTMRRETAVLTNIKALTQATALAEAGINLAMVHLLPTDEKLRWRSDSSLYEVPFEGGRIRIRVADESGKLDLNSGDPNMLRSMLGSLGLDEDQLNQLAAAIIDWHDPDDIQTPGGAEKEQYQQAGLQFTPSNKPFETVEELQMVLGMKPEYFKQLEPLVTVFSHSNSINPAKASREILLKFPSVTPEMVDAYIQQRADNARAGLPDVLPPWAKAGAGASQVFEIVAEAMPVEGITGAVTAVVKRGPSRQKLPFSILKWQKSSIEHSLFSASEDSQVMLQ